MKMLIVFIGGFVLLNIFHITPIELNVRVNQASMPQEQVIQTLVMIVIVLIALRVFSGITRGGLSLIMHSAFKLRMFPRQVPEPIIISTFDSWEPYDGPPKDRGERKTEGVKKWSDLSLFLKDSAWFAVFLVVFFVLCGALLIGWIQATQIKIPTTLQYNYAQMYLAIVSRTVVIQHALSVLFQIYLILIQMGVGAVISGGLAYYSYLRYQKKRLNRSVTIIDF